MVRGTGSFPDKNTLNITVPQLPVDAWECSTSWECSISYLTQMCQVKPPDIMCKTNENNGFVYEAAIKHDGLYSASDRRSA